MNEHFQSLSDNSIHGGSVMRFTKRPQIERQIVRKLLDGQRDWASRLWWTSAPLCQISPCSPNIYEYISIYMSSVNRKLLFREALEPVRVVRSAEFNMQVVWITAALADSAPQAHGMEEGPNSSSLRLCWRQNKFLYPPVQQLAHNHFVFRWAGDFVNPPELLKVLAGLAEHAKDFAVQAQLV